VRVILSKLAQKILFTADEKSRQKKTGRYHLGIDLSIDCHIIMQMTNKQSQLDQVFHALADPTRRAVLERLGRGPASVTELAGRFEMALPSFVQHLKVLEQSGLIRSRKVGRVRTCKIAPRQMKSAERWLAEQREFWERRLNQLDDYVLELKAKEKK
jgi:DNA-binding transcriptional ArsR family regulator